MRISDWSSDVCSSDLGSQRRPARRPCRRSGTADLRRPGPPGRDSLLAFLAFRFRIAAGHGPGLVCRLADHLHRAALAQCDLAGGHHRVAELQAAEDLGPVAVGIAGLRSEEHTSELQSLMRISYAVFCLKKKKQKNKQYNKKSQV